mmetsp:Transcript_32898/g.97047  ORF Transcript_32898/g.97047 Transcript_32898/m.97047 type:complete len:348 (-) Transcript_32898:346-1389(-)
MAQHVAGDPNTGLLHRGRPERQDGDHRRALPKSERFAQQQRRQWRRRQRRWWERQSVLLGGHPQAPRSRGESRRGRDRRGRQPPRRHPPVLPRQRRGPRQHLPVVQVPQQEPRRQRPGVRLHRIRPGHRSGRPIRGALLRRHRRRLLLPAGHPPGPRPERRPVRPLPRLRAVVLPGQPDRRRRPPPRRPHPPRPLPVGVPRRPGIGLHPPRRQVSQHRLPALRPKSRHAHPRHQGPDRPVPSLGAAAGGRRAAVPGHPPPHRGDGPQQHPSHGPAALRRADSGIHEGARQEVGGGGGSGRQPPKIGEQQREPREAHDPGIRLVSRTTVGIRLQEAGPIAQRAPSYVA